MPSSLRHREDSMQAGIWPEDGGETGALIRSLDWSETSLGPIGRWPQSLRTTVDILLRSPVPMVLLWGPDGIMIYNDAYSAFAGGRHPRLLGSKVLEGWPEVADFSDRVMKVGLSGGTLAYRDQELTLYRSGVAEQVWFNLDYSPILDESGKPAGVMAIVVETTERVRAEAALRHSWHHSRDLLGIAGTDGIIRAANPALIESLGYTSDEVIGRSYLDFVFLEDVH